eukprot:848202-Prorocentrum_minimum.AAC.2
MSARLTGEACTRSRHASPVKRANFLCTSKNIFGESPSSALPVKGLYIFTQGHNDAENLRHELDRVHPGREAEDVLGSLGSRRWLAALGRAAPRCWDVEQGERVPTIVTLRKIVGSIAVPIPCASKLQSNPSTESDEGR